jgi:hypothetical protein
MSGLRKMTRQKVTSSLARSIMFSLVTASSLLVVQPSVVRADPALCLEKAAAYRPGKPETDLPFLPPIWDSSKNSSSRSEGMNDFLFGLLRFTR